MTDTVTFEDFLKVDIRAGKITEAERVPGSNKLLKLTVDFGELGTRQVLAGIGKTFDPEALVAQQATTVFVVNLAPRKMMGLESHAMILGAATDEPEPYDLTLMFLDHHVKPGTRIG